MTGAEVDALNNIAQAINNAGVSILILAIVHFFVS